MVDFKKRLGSKSIEKKINPIEIYDSLDRRSETGPLRPAQEHILKEWYNERKDRNNLIIKLHTGQGKTLIGLLILHSKLNSKNSPCLYVCPNIYLAKQTVQEAKKFGIPHCSLIDEKEIPDEFLNGDKILITYVQKVFNGKSVFGLNNNSINVNSIILDDSHACIDSIKSSFTINIKKEESIYTKMLTLFYEDLENQGEGSLLDIKEGKFETILAIPYWSWINKKTEVLKLLAENEDQNKSILFTWSILKNNIVNYKAIISGSQIEITPYYIPMFHFGSFANAKHRVLMSATTQDDSFFIKGLQFDLQTINEPLINTEQKWSGEKMLIIPSLIDELLIREEIVNKYAKPEIKKYGIVSLVPNTKFTLQYSEYRATIASATNIFELIQSLKNGKFEKTVVITNRYDGIDLPDDSCRLLIIDSKPYFRSLSDIYEETCRANSEVINTQIAQKIEQGLGRSVRGEKDYSAIIITGADLVKFIKSSATSKFFSEQTRKQIEIGLEIASLAKEDLDKKEHPIKVVESLLRQSLDRDEGWKEFYKEKMDEIEFEKVNSSLLELINCENEAEYYHYSGNNEKAISTIQKIIDNYCDTNDERGWYLQTQARYKYAISVLESNKLQLAAFKANYQLLHPKEGLSYNKINYININRIDRIKKFIDGQESYNELILSIDHILGALVFGMSSEKFELALQELGSALGFISQRPDKEYKKGPDNLWCGINDKYVLFECKSEVAIDRGEINKYEAGQMNSHCGWFKETYGEKFVKRILIIPTKKLSYHANFTDNVEIMRLASLKKLKENVKGFFKEFKNFDIKEISEEKINEFIKTHELTIDDITDKYSEVYYHNKK